MRKRRSLTSLVLLALEKTVDGMVLANDFVNNMKDYSVLGRDYPLKKSDLSQAFKRLRERGLIEYVSDEKLAYRLTDSGKQKATWEAILADNQKWDGKWRVVVFDVPERRKEARNLLRASLKNWGFVQWQKSVWATKKDCTKPLRKFISDVGIEDWVIVLESDNAGL